MCFESIKSVNIPFKMSNVIYKGTLYKPSYFFDRIRNENVILHKWVYNWKKNAAVDEFKFVLYYVSRV